MATVPLDLAPTPGFCVKSAAGPGSQKVFVNICYDKNVPPPPPADEATIKRAMNIHQDDDDDDGNYYVPVVVSQPRQDRDKGRYIFLLLLALFWVAKITTSPTLCLPILSVISKFRHGHHTRSELLLIPVSYACLFAGKSTITSLFYSM